MRKPLLTQFSPPGLQPLPPLRLFRVTRMGVEGVEVVNVQATSLALDTDGVLKFTELVYDKHPTTGELEMLLYVRRMFRHWEDVEEVVGAAVQSSGLLN